MISDTLPVERLSVFLRELLLAGPASRDHSDLYTCDTISAATSLANDALRASILQGRVPPISVPGVAPQTVILPDTFVWRFNEKVEQGWADVRAFEAASDPDVQAGYSSWMSRKQRLISSAGRVV